MKALTAQEIRGTYATILLPLDGNDEIDWKRLQTELDVLLATGIDGIYCNGTAGEFYSLSDAEFLQLNEILARRCEEAAIPFQIGATFPTAQLALERARQAARLQPGAIQVVLPDWYPLTLQEAATFLERIANAVQPVPLVLYNPPHAKQVLGAVDYEMLCERIPALVGIKVGGGDEAWYQGMHRLSGRLSIFVPGHALATGFVRGASGSYSNVACLQPKGAKRWNELMASNWQAAREVEVQIQEFLRLYISPFRDQRGFSNMALDKLLAYLGDWAPVGLRLRWPYAGIDEREAEPLRRVVRQKIPFLFDEFLPQAERLD
jgi:dihydrodipicolinate synthase/N-acetylneuraminate lyase